MILSALAALALTAAHPYSIQDQLAMRRVSSPTVSPDGKHVAFVLRTTDFAANKGRTDVWVVNADGSNLRQLTRHEANDDQPVWSPDGQSLYFLSTRSGSNQVYRAALAGGDEVQVTKLPLDVGAFALSRDGKQLALALEVFPDCPTLQCTTERLSAQEKDKSSGRLYEHLLYRHWDTWSNGTRSHLFVLPASGTGTPRDLMPGMDADAPTKPFGGSEEFTFTPDGTGVVFTARDVGRTEAWSTDLDLFVAPTTGAGKAAAPRKLTTQNRATDTSPSFSPDGKTLAYLAMERPMYESDRLRVVLRSWPDGKERVLTQKWDRSAGALSWSADGKTLFTTADEVGNHPAFALDVATGEPRRIVKDGHAGDPQPLAGGRVLFALDSLGAPADLWSVGADGSEPRQLTKMNAEALADIRFGEYEQFSFPGWNGETVHGYVVKPVGFDPKKKYPVAFLIHGGPQGSFGSSWSYRWNPQFYAGAGYAAVMVDFHGSTGYGQAFTDAIRDDWGGKPLEDLQKGLDAALKRYAFLDESRMCALGASYGGYMINWIAGNWSDRFKCLVNHDGIFDTRIGYYDTEETWFPEWEHGGTPWDKPQAFEKHNPANFVKNWKTPMMVVQGGKDYRVVETQGISTFTALQRKGIPSQFLYFPDENHWVLKTANSRKWHETVLAWFVRWAMLGG